MSIVTFYVLIAYIIFAIIVLLKMLFNQISTYRKSEKFLDKLETRKKYLELISLLEPMLKK